MSHAGEVWISRDAHEVFAVVTGRDERAVGVVFVVDDGALIARGHAAAVEKLRGALVARGCNVPIADVLDAVAAVARDGRPRALP